jgi:hypothetical protein
MLVGELPENPEDFKEPREEYIKVTLGGLKRLKDMTPTPLERFM